MIYTADNIAELVKKIQSDSGIDDYKKYYFKKIREALQVHTQGTLFDKVITLFENEDPESSKYILNSYEAVTKSSIWKGIDNIGRIFQNSGFDIVGDAETIKALSDSNFFTDYINEFITTSTAIDPNTVSVWMLEEDGLTWENEFIETQFIKLINEDEIAFIDVENSDYTIERKPSTIVTRGLDYMFNYNEKNRHVRSYFEGVEYKFGKNVRYIYINKKQYVTIDYNGTTANVTFKDIDIKKPYSETGVERVTDGVYNSAVAGFLPHGNQTLIQHRQFRAVEVMFSFPRMSEIETPCDVCHRGEVPCDPCEQYPDGLMPCKKCKGSGNMSLQSPFNIYKKKVSPETGENISQPIIEFYTPDIGILNYNAEAWKNSLKMAEEAIYVQQRTETGNVESAKSREYLLEGMYSWLNRIAEVIFDNIQDSLDNYCLLNGYNTVKINKPISFAIMGELDAFDYLNTIVSTDAPVFLKTVHVEKFLHKYVSKTSPIIKIVDILKRVDPFVFYTQKDLQALSDSGIISDIDWRTHSYAYPLLMNLYAQDPTLLDNEYSVIEQRLRAEIATKQPRQIA